MNQNPRMLKFLLFAILVFIVVDLLYYFVSPFPLPVRIMFSFLTTLVFTGSAYEFTVYYMRRRSHRHYLNARSFYQAGDYEKAELECQKALSAYPNNESAEKLLKELKTLKAQDLLVNLSDNNELQIAWNYYKLGRFDKAIAELERFSSPSKEILQLLQLAKDSHSDVHYTKAVEHYEKAEFTQARIELQEVLRIQPRHAEAKNLLAKALTWEELENKKAASKLLEESKVSYETEDLSAAFKKAQDAHALCPDDENVSGFYNKILHEARMRFNDLMSQFNELKKSVRLKEAKSAVQLALSYFPQDEEALGALDAVDRMLQAHELFDQTQEFISRGLTDHAIDNLKKTVKLDPDFTDARVLLAELGKNRACHLIDFAKDLEKQGNLEEGIRALDEVLEICPQMSEAASYRLVLVNKKEANGLLEQAKVCVSKRLLSKALELTGQSQEKIMLDEAISLHQELLCAMQKLDADYKKAVSLEDGRKLFEAAEQYHAIWNKAEDFKDVESRLNALSHILNTKHKLRLELRLSGVSKKHYVILSGKAVKIGRHSTCDLVVKEPEVSREHAQLYFDGVQFILEDLQSKNGTTIDGGRIVKSSLSTNQIVGCADSRLLFSIRNAGSGNMATGTETMVDTITTGKGNKAETERVASAHLTFMENESEPEYIVLIEFADIGKGSNNDIQIHGRFIEERHCRLTCREGQFFVEPLSTLQHIQINKTQINGRTILVPDDVIGFGGQEHELIITELC